jgi:hypothetical protein
MWSIVVNSAKSDPAKKMRRATKIHSSTFKFINHTFCFCPTPTNSQPATPQTEMAY